MIALRSAEIELLNDQRRSLLSIRTGLFDGLRDADKAKVPVTSMLSNSRSPLDSFLGEITWARHSGDPTRELVALRDYAARAVELTGRTNSPLLDTLARVHWERGDKMKAIEVQREALAAPALDVNSAVLDEMWRAFTKYETQEPPSARAPTEALQ